jgi:translation initiation factor 3 subunit B
MLVIHRAFTSPLRLSWLVLESIGACAAGLRDFEWSPKDNILAYWYPDSRDQRMCVNLVDAITKKSIKAVKKVDVEHCELYWQSEGEYLCVKVRPCLEGIG